MRSTITEKKLRQICKNNWVSENDLWKLEDYLDNYARPYDVRDLIRWIYERSRISDGPLMVSRIFVAVFDSGEFNDYLNEEDRCKSEDEYSRPRDYKRACKRRDFKRLGIPL